MIYSQIIKESEEIMKDVVILFTYVFKLVLHLSQPKGHPQDDLQKSVDNRDMVKIKSIEHLTLITTDINLKATQFNSKTSNPKSYIKTQFQI